MSLFPAQGSDTGSDTLDALDALERGVRGVLGVLGVLRVLRVFGVVVVDIVGGAKLMAVRGWVNPKDEGADALPCCDREG